MFRCGYRVITELLIAVYRKEIRLPSCKTDAWRHG